MTKYYVGNFIDATIKNEGDKREWAVCAYYGITRTTHDGKAYNKASDVDTGNKRISVKSSQCTLMSGSLCRGCSTFEGIWRRYRKQAHSEYTAYVTEDFYVYEMDMDEFSKFVHTFGRLGHESTSKGGELKMRVLKESKKMVKWLEERV